MIETLGAWQRAQVLDWASAITSNPADPIAVRANALAMLEWINAGADEGDIRNRWRALMQHEHNTRRDRDTVTDNPGNFIAGAAVLYGFIAG